MSLNDLVINKDSPPQCNTSGEDVLGKGIVSCKNVQLNYIGQDEVYVNWKCPSCLGMYCLGKKAYYSNEYIASLEQGRLESAMIELENFLVDSFNLGRTGHPIEKKILQVSGNLISIVLKHYPEGSRNMYREELDNETV